MRRILLFLTIFLIVKLAAASQRDYPFKVYSHAVPGGQVLMLRTKARHRFWQLLDCLILSISQSISHRL